MEQRTVNQGSGILARHDRIPVWPYRRSLLWVLGFGFFFASFDAVTIGFALPVIVRQFGVTSAQAARAITSSLLGYILGAFLDSFVADRLGRRLSLALSVSLFTVGSLVAIGGIASGAMIVIGGFVASSAIGLLVPVLYTYTAEHFATSFRATEVAVTDGLGHLGGALAPAVVLAAHHHWGFAGAFYVMALSVLITALPLPFGMRTTGRALERIAP